MYTYSRAVGALKSHISSVQFLDISESILKNIIDNYRLLFIVVEDGLYNKEVTIDLLHYRNELVDFDGNIQQWLDTKKNVPLEYSTTIPPKDYQYARMEDMQMSGYVPYPAKYELSVSLQQKLTMSGAEDIRLSHPANPKYHDITDRCLFTYNGHFIRAIPSNEGIYLLGGGRNYRVNDTGGIGCISFANFARLTSHYFKPENIHADEDEFGLSFRISFPKPIDDKTLWLVIGGKLVIDQELFQKVNDSEVVINLERLQTAYNLFESRHYIDLNNVPGVEAGVIRHTKKQIIEMYRALLANTNSFYILFDNPHMGIYVEPLQVYQFPTTFVSHETFNHPLMLDNGMFPVHRKRPGYKCTLLDVAIRYSPNYLSKTYGSRKPGYLIHDRTDHGNPRKPTRGYHFKIYSLLRK